MTLILKNKPASQDHSYCSCHEQQDKNQNISETFNRENMSFLNMT